MTDIYTMDFPIELWREIKAFAGIYTISTEWTFPHVYPGNWIQFYLEWFKPSAEDINKIRDADHIKQEMFTRAFSHLHWSRVHFLNRAHAELKEIGHVHRSCNALLEVDPYDITEDYDMIEFYIPFFVEKHNELELLQSIHSLLDRCHMTRIFYYYQPGSLILSVNV
jgi:hypothetical protein